MTTQTVAPPATAQPGARRRAWWRPGPAGGSGSRRSLAGLIRDRDAIAIAIPTVLGAVLCLIELGVRSLWLDESATISIASQHGAALAAGIAHDGGNMLAYYVLMHVIALIFGDGVSVMRAPSVISVAVTAGMVAALGLRLFSDRRLALAAGMLTCVSLPLVFWGQDARGYAPMVALVTASYVALVAILQTPPGSPVRRRTIWLYGLSTLLGLYVGFDTALIIPGQLLLLLVFPERARIVLRAIAVVALCCIPLVVLATVRGTGQLFWVPSLGMQSLGEAAVTLLSAGLPPNFHENALTYVIVALSALLTIAGIGAAAAAVWRRGLRSGLALLIVAGWVVVPAVVALLVAAFGKPVELSRCAPMAMPGLALLFAWALRHPRLPSYTGLAGLAVLLGLRMAVLVPTYGVSPEDWKAATAYVVATNGTQRACVVFYSQDSRMPFDYYLLRSSAAARAALTPVIPATPWGTIKPFVEQYNSRGESELGQIVESCPRLWLIASHSGSSGGTGAARADYRRYQALVANLGWVYPKQSEQTFGWAAAVYVFHLSR